MTCTKCSIDKLPEEFHLSSRQCKDCRHAYYVANRERFRAAGREYYFRVREAKAADMRERSLAYWNSNKERLKPLRSERETARYRADPAFRLKELERGKAYRQRKAAKRNWPS